EHAVALGRARAPGGGQSPPILGRLRRGPLNGNRLGLQRPIYGKRLGQGAFVRPEERKWGPGSGGLGTRTPRESIGNCPSVFHRFLTALLADVQLFNSGPHAVIRPLLCRD